MVIYLTHPEHGSKVATCEEEAVYDEANGWKRQEVAALFKPAEPSQLDTLRQEYERRFGTRPHHRKTAETLKTELEVA
jgi:hypothetical protein